MQPLRVMGSNHDIDVVDEELARWERAGLITHEQAVRIHAVEAVQPTTATTPLIVEILVYLGLAAVLAAVAALVGQQWESIPFGARLALIATLAVVAGAIAVGLRSRGEAASRAASVLFAGSVGLTAGVGAVIVDQVTPQRDWESMLIVGGPAFVLALAYLRLTPRALQVLAAVGTSIPVALSGVDLLWGEVTDTYGSMTVAAIGFYGVARASSLWPIEPARFAEGLFAGTLLFGIWSAAVQEDALWAEFVGLAAAGTLLTFSVQIRSTRFLVAGGIGLFAFLTMLVTRHLSDQIGAPLALLLSGIALIGAAVLVLRLHRAASATDADGARSAS